MASICQSTAEGIFSHSSSNETSNGYFLERSHSARMTLAKACELCPEEVKRATSLQEIEMEESKVILYRPLTVLMIVSFIRIARLVFAFNM